ncbi:hypothetical protein [Desulfosporosinus meridiei]|uniref:Uncharacterized protein n=1 Tax=Desulfosporosinus meridiei (strain ATCC BAA-275 / DSM 13257 / KCTC 12902 / NCIMB 13706 / S10) TaxID=768704 RepID=J7IRL4_DESMD|nr:hypothetical protein [Desulfosporosinus meridiei]AFQ42814.1 hypothetical protein Desmer_0782 [Desulfosporosinus meridiei DSM 13257]
MNRLILVLFGIALACIGLTFLLAKLSFKNKITKYLPALLCLLAGLYYLYIANNANNVNGFEDLANLMLSLMLFAGSVGGAVTGLIFDLLKKKS